MRISQLGRNYDQAGNANPLVERVLVPYTLKFLKVKSYWKHLTAVIVLVLNVVVKKIWLIYIVSPAIEVCKRLHRHKLNFL